MEFSDSFCVALYPLQQCQAQTDATSRAPSGVTSSQQNPLQIATLHWYNANLTASFTMGTAPYGIAFDGTNLWICNNGSNNVVKVRTSDGAILGTFAVGTNPIAVAYDGANVWVANINSKNVTKLNGSTGAVLGTFTVGTLPAGLAFDGTNIWVANNGSNNVTKLLASTGAIKGTFTVGTNPAGILFDGTNIWVADNGSATSHQDVDQRHDIGHFLRWNGADRHRV